MSRAHPAENGQQAAMRDDRNAEQHHGSKIAWIEYLDCLLRSITPMMGKESSYTGSIGALAAVNRLGTDSLGLL
jgi:hypothetical protein